MQALMHFCEWFLPLGKKISSFYILADYNGRAQKSWQIGKAQQSDNCVCGFH